MRAEITDRFYRTFTYQTVDRVPNVEFGYWPQTIRRWLREGLPLDLTPKETEDMFLTRLDDYFGFERGWSYSLPMRVGMIPAFDEQVLERRVESVIMRDVDGVIAERYQHDVERSSIPRFIEFPGGPGNLAHIAAGQQQETIFQPRLGGQSQRSRDSAEADPEHAQLAGIDLFTRSEERGGMSNIEHRLGHAFDGLDRIPRYHAFRRVGGTPRSIVRHFDKQRRGSALCDGIGKHAC